MIGGDYVWLSSIAEGGSAGASTLKVQWQIVERKKRILSCGRFDNGG
jgi:hypothetical protein